MLSIADKLARELHTEFLRLNPLGPVSIRRATPADLSATLEWLREEKSACRTSFYHAAEEIELAQEDGRAFVARADDHCIGLLVDWGKGPDIIAVHSAYHRRGIGRRLLELSVKLARQRGRTEIEAHCVTEAGKQLCRRMGFRYSRRLDRHKFKVRGLI